MGEAFGSEVEGSRLILDHVWYWRSRLPERKGQRCRVVVRAKRMNSIAVEFEDGQLVCTSRYAVRPCSPAELAQKHPLPETQLSFGW